MLDLSTAPRVDVAPKVVSSFAYCIISHIVFSQDTALRLRKNRARKDNLIPPQCVRDAIAAAGGLVEKCPGEKLYSITNIEFGDNAWKKYEEWAATVERDPIVQALFAPSPAIAGVVLCPPLAMVGHILNEANSIIAHYAPLLEHQVFGPAPPAIPGPLAAAPINVHVRHPKVALSALMQRIQDPPATYPVLAALNPGSYICTVQQVWGNGVVAITLFKPT